MWFLGGRDAVVDCDWKLIIYSLVPARLLLLCVPSYCCHNTSDCLFNSFLCTELFLGESDDSQTQVWYLENYCSTRFLAIIILDKNSSYSCCYQEYYCSYRTMHSYLSVDNHSVKSVTD